MEVEMGVEDTAWTSLKTRICELEALEAVIQLLEWDQQTMMPPGGSAHRGVQLATISALMHDKTSDPQLGEWLGVLSDSDDPHVMAAVRNLGRSHRRAVQIPSRLVADIATASNVGFGAWMAAREANDFGQFEGALERLVSLRRDEVACQGPAAHPYDHLLEQYDPGSTTAQLQPMFARLRPELANFIDTVSSRPRPKSVSGKWAVNDQRCFSHSVISTLGFRLNDGRLDSAAHPFTVGMGRNDVRLTTHLYEDDLLGGLTGTIHEAGHGMYEQGLPADLAGTSIAAAAGMGLHESQSRFWENVIGRSLPFFEWLVPLIKQHFPDDNLSPADWYGHANRVERSLIRIQADEATYNLHIIIRFELELALLSGELSVADLPDAWNAAYRDLLGVSPDSPNDGVLQDVHWSNGLFGYFPSYTIGNLYAASFRYQMQDDVPDMWTNVADGDFGPVLAWLRDKVHRHGHSLDAPDIFRAAVGDRDPVADLMAHLNERQAALNLN
jgi:carboxypeptidase Taq